MCIVILFVIIIILIVLTIRRLYTLKKLKKTYKDNMKKVKQRYFALVEENAKLKTFRYETENLVTGKRTPEEIIEKIKELLFDRNNNPN